MNKLLKEPSPQRAEALRTAGLFADSVDCFTQWLQDNPNDAWSLAHRGAARASLGDHKAAIVDFDDAIKLKEQRYPWAFAQKGEAYRVYIRDCMPWTRNNLHDLKLSIKHSLDAFESSIEPTRSYSWAFAHKGATHSLAYFLHKLYPELGGNLDEHAQPAEDCFKAATELNPTYAWAYAFWAVLHGVQGHFSRASELMGKALTVDINGRMHPHRALAELSYWDRDFSNALTQASLARQEDPEDALITYYIAQSLEAMKDPSAKAAIDYARRRLSSLLNIVHMLLAGVYHVQGHDYKAKEMIEFLLGKQDLESMFIAEYDPLWEKVKDDESDLGRVFRALRNGDSKTQRR
jgi:tetratricopeptide (TPR) repeat protein